MVLDPAHGGSDAGARLGDGLVEKDLTLKLAERLAGLLRVQGDEVVMTRVADEYVPMLDREETANHARAAVCLVIHATATGSGVHLFASSLNPEPMKGALPWATAQAAYVTQSLKLESEIAVALAHEEIPVTMGRVAVPPVDSLACPAVVVELAPLAAGNTTSGKPITNAKYQQTAEGAVAAAVKGWRRDWAER